MVELVRLVITKINNRGKTEQSRKIKMEEKERLTKKNLRRISMKQNILTVQIIIKVK